MTALDGSTGPNFLAKAMLVAGRVARQPFAVPGQMTDSAWNQGGATHVLVGEVNQAARGAYEALQPRGPMKWLGSLFDRVDHSLDTNVERATMAKELFWSPVSEGAKAVGQAVANPFAFAYANRAGFELPGDPAALRDMLTGILDKAGFPLPEPPADPTTPPDGGEPAPPDGDAPKPPDGDTPAPPEGDTPKPPEGDTPAPPEGDTPAPPEGDAPKPPEGDTPAPPEGDAPKPPEGDTPAPPEGDTPAPPEGDAPKPPEGDAPKPPEGDAPAPPEGDAPKPPEGDAPVPPEGDAPKPPEGGAPSAAGMPDDAAMIAALLEGMANRQSAGAPRGVVPMTPPVAEPEMTKPVMAEHAPVEHAPAPTAAMRPMAPPTR